MGGLVSAVQPVSAPQGCDGYIAAPGEENGFLGAVAKLRNANMSFVTSVCMSVRPHPQMEQLGSQWTGLREILYVGDFRKSVEKFQSDTNSGTLHEADRYTFMIISRADHLRMRNVSGKTCRENQNTYFVFSNFFPKKCRLWDTWKNIVRTAGQTIHDNVAHAQCMLDT